MIPGHGDPFDDVEAALSRAFRRLETFESDPMRLVRHALKVVLMFELLDCRRLPLDGVAGFVGRVPLSRLQRAVPQACACRLAGWLVDELLRAGAVRQEGGWIVPRPASLARRSGAPTVTTVTPRPGSYRLMSSAGLPTLSPSVMPYSERLIVAGRTACARQTLLAALEVRDLKQRPTAW